MLFSHNSLYASLPPDDSECLPMICKSLLQCTVYETVKIKVYTSVPHGHIKPKWISNNVALYWIFSMCSWLSPKIPRANCTEGPMGHTHHCSYTKSQLHRGFYGSHTPIELCCRWAMKEKVLFWLILQKSKTNIVCLVVASLRVTSWGHVRQHASRAMVSGPLPIKY